jgi:TldD protein
LVDEPIYPNGIWISSYLQNPFAVSDDIKLALLSDWSDRLLKAGVDHVYAKIRAGQENKYYADSAGTVTSQQRVRLYPQLTALSIDRQGGSFETLRTLGPPASRGWEYVLGNGWDWNAELARMPELLAEKTRAPTAMSGTYDAVIDASNLWLTIHETIGHATELDRVLGFEAGYAGTSFATLDRLGQSYGSALLNVVADRTTEHGLATIGYDDEGVAAQQWDLIRDGILVGYQVTRRLAHVSCAMRSNGCAFAESGGDLPVPRMPNVSMMPAKCGPTVHDLIAEVRDGLYIVGDKSWSIDMNRSNFQFSAQLFFKIERGKLVGQLRHLAYQGNTSDFWLSLNTIGDKSTYKVYGADYCGKAQPIQIAAASHGTPAALFPGLRVINVHNVAGT